MAAHPARPPMNAMVLIFALLAGLLVEVALPAWAAAGRVKAPVLLAVVLYYGLDRTAWLMLAAATVGGFLLDGLCSLPIGVSVPGLALVGAMARRRRDFVFGNRKLTHALLGAVAAAMFVMVTWLVMRLAGCGPQASDLADMAVRAAGAGALGLIVVPAAVCAMRRLDRVVGNVEEQDRE